VPLRADGSPCRAFRSPGSRIAAFVRLPEVLETSVAWSGRRLLAHSCATAPASHRIPLVPVEILRALGGKTHPALVGGRRHREIEAIGCEREVKVAPGEARPVTARELLIAL
jgi:hypothetical protein